MHGGPAFFERFLESVAQAFQPGPRPRVSRAQPGKAVPPTNASFSGFMAGPKNQVRPLENRNGKAAGSLYPPLRPGPVLQLCLKMVPLNNFGFKLLQERQYGQILFSL
jgi:hypothetical protein